MSTKKEKCCSQCRVSNPPCSGSCYCHQIERTGFELDNGSMGVSASTHIQSESIECERQFDWFGYRFSSTSESIEWDERIKTQIEYLGESGMNTVSFRKCVFEAIRAIFQEAITTAVAKRDKFWIEEGIPPIERDAVRKGIATREKELAEEVEKIRKENCYSENVGKHKCDSVCEAMQVVLSIIQH